MGYAKRNDEKGWRAVNSANDVLPGETYSETEPVLRITLAETLIQLAAAYKADMSQLNVNWLSAAVSNGTSEPDRKSAVTQAIADRKAKYIADVAAARASYTTP